MAPASILERLFKSKRKHRSLLRPSGEPLDMTTATPAEFEVKFSKKLPEDLHTESLATSSVDYPPKLPPLSWQA
jgi:hypothetical protein